MESNAKAEVERMWKVKIAAHFNVTCDIPAFPGRDLGTPQEISE